MSDEAPTMEDLRAQVKSMQDLLRAARYYVYHADVPHEGAYDDQQAMLQRIDEAAPPPPAAPKSQEPCERDPKCVWPKGHSGDCDDLPF